MDEHPTWRRNSSGVLSSTPSVNWRPFPPGFMVLTHLGPGSAVRLAAAHGVIAECRDWKGVWLELASLFAPLSLHQENVPWLPCWRARYVWAEQSMWHPSQGHPTCLQTRRRASQDQQSKRWSHEQEVLIIRSLNVRFVVICYVALLGNEITESGNSRLNISRF